MNSFERTTTTEKTSENKQFTRPIYFADDYKDHINSGLDSLSTTLESLSFTPNRSRVVYMGAASTETNAAFNLDITKASRLDSMVISAYGGAFADPTIYRYNAHDGSLTKQTQEMRAPRAIATDELIARLYEDYPDNATIHDLHDSPTDTMDPDFVIYAIENAMTDYAERSSAEKASQARYSTTEMMATANGLPADRVSELIITKTDKGEHYNLDIDTPHQSDDVDIRKSVNYQITHSTESDKWGDPKCTVTLHSGREIQRAFAEKAVQTEQNDAYFAILQAIDSLEKSDALELLN